MIAARLREYRVSAFCDWLESIPPSPPFHTRPEYRFYSDMSDAERLAVAAEMERRAATYDAKSAALNTELGARQ